MIQPDTPRGRWPLGRIVDENAKKKVREWRVVRLARARAETFKFYQFLRKLRVRFLACVFFSFSRIFFQFYRLLTD